MEKFMPTLSAIPTVDLSPFMDGGDEYGRKKAKDIISKEYGRKKAKYTIYKACTDLGVIQIENHGLSLDLMEQLMELSKTFFGYSYYKKVEFTEPDKSKSGAGYTKRPIDPYNNFDYLLMFPPEIPFNGVPTNPPDYRKTFEEVYKYFLKTAQIVEEIINECLGLPPNFLKEYNNDRSSDSLIVMNYPEASETDNMGIAAHEDPNIITIILEDDVEGLEVCKDGKWIPVIPTKGKLVVIIGDLIQVLSNKKFRNVTHRALRHKGKSRCAVDFCYNLQGDKWVMPMRIHAGDKPKYRGFYYKDYLDLKLKDDQNPPARPEDFIRITHYEI